MTRTPQVLVVDADADLFVLLEQWLGTEGFASRTPADGADAAPVALIVVDMPFPSRQHVDALRAAHDPHGQVPILMLSSSVFASVDCRGATARSLGVDGLLPKPTSGDALRRAVRSLTRP